MNRLTEIYVNEKALLCIYSVSREGSNKEPMYQIIAGDTLITRAEMGELLDDLDMLYEDLFTDDKEGNINDR